MYDWFENPIFIPWSNQSVCPSIGYSESLPQNHAWPLFFLAKKEAIPLSENWEPDIVILQALVQVNVEGSPMYDVQKFYSFCDH